MKKNYLVQYLTDEREVVTSLMTANEVIKYDNESDIYGINGMRVWDCSEYGQLKELSSAGWQPNCEITWADTEGNVVIHGYGEDH